jgi:23S rRNA (pseudouridine1915-N3)-methyltransferase
LAFNITIAAIGQKLPSWCEEAVADFQQRFASDWRVEIKQLKAEPRSSGLATSVIMQREAERIRAIAPRAAQLIVLDEHGTRLDTKAFSALLQRKADDAQDLVFCIGGADGLDPTLKAQAAERIRLSDMTLPHAFARLILIEQIYRAYSILHKHPYHRE